MLGVLFLAIAISGTVACSNVSGASPHDGTSPPVLFIRGTDGTFASVFPAELDLYLGATPTFQLWMSGGHAGMFWSIDSRLARDQATTGKVNVTLSDGPIAEGIGVVGLTSGDSGVATATSGTFRASISGGKITGDVQATPSILGASIEGELSVVCWIPGSGSPGDGGGLFDSSGSEVLVQDPAMSSKLCEPFKPLR